MTQAEMRNLGRFSPPSYPQSECFRPVTGNGAGTEMMASGAFAVVPTPVSARTVAGCRRGTPWTKRTGVGRVGGHTKEPPNEVRLHGRISQRVPPLHAVREPSKGERGVELASTSFGGHEDNQRGALMTQAEMRNLGRFSPPSYPQSECFRPVTGNGAGTEMMASGAFAVVPTPVSARTVAGCRRGTPWTKRTGVGRVGGHTKEPPNEVRLHGRISQRVPPLHAVREPSKGERGVELASTSFGGHEDNQRGAESDTNTTHTDAARRVRNAKTNAARYHSRVGVSVDEDEEETVETSASGGSTAATKQSTSTPTKPVKKGGGRRGKSYPLSRRGTGGTQPLNEGKGGIAASKLTSKLNKRKTKYNRPSSSGIVDKSMDRSVDMSGDDSDSELLVRGNDDRPRWLSNTHTKKPGQQAQQKRNSSGPQKNGMRPGERIVAALQKVPVADTVERFSGATTDSMAPVRPRNQ